MSTSRLRPTLTQRRWRSTLEVVLMVMMIAVCAVILAQSFRQSRPAVPSRATPGVRLPPRTRPDPPLPPHALSIATAPIKGAKNAPVVIVQFSDFHCPFCARFTDQTLAPLEEKYFSKGTVQMAFRHFPLESLHPNASRAAEMAHCAQQQGRFWQAHDLLFEDPKGFAEAAFLARVTALVPNHSQFTACLGENTTRSFVKNDQKMGADAGVTGTPTFSVGFLGRDASVVAKERLSGAAPLAKFIAVIDRLLTKTE